MEEKETYWSRFAEDFEKRNNYVAGKETIIEIMDKILDQEEFNNCLELGCGNGTYSKVLSANSQNLIATDFSDAMLNVCTKKLKAYLNIKVEKANCFKLQYNKNTFDTVFMANLLHIIPNPVNAIKEAKRVLKPGGSIIIVSFTTEGMTLFNKLTMIYRYLKTYGKPPSTSQRLSLNKVINYLINNNFNIAEAKLLGNSSKAIFIKGIKQI